ncbi:MAG: NUDIX hydrolase [Candidatus Odinarchaeota archaeon]
MQNINILWEGELKLDFIKWNKKKNNEFRLTSKYDSNIQTSWTQHIKENPNDYDGSLIFLDHFHFDNNLLYLDTSYIKFSTVMFMLKNNIRVENGIGVLGCQYLVFSPKKQYVLIGERSPSQSYFPGAITIPGGILEIDDLNKPPKKAFMRELNEEVNLPFKEELFLNAVLEGWNGTSVTFLISTIIHESYNFNPKKSVLAEEDEWKDNLFWISTEELKRISNKHFLDGLIYYQSKLLENSSK